MRIAAAQVVRGEVRDGSGAVVPGAAVVIRSQDTGFTAATESNGVGLYISPTLLPGDYLISASKAGFRTEVFGPVTLQVNITTRVDFGLHVGPSTETIQVEAGGIQLLATESADLAQVIVRKQVAEMPLNGRNWQQLIALSAGVNPGAPGETGSPNPVNIHGQRTKGNLFLVDGVSTTSSAQGRGNNFNVPLEAVREFSVQSGAYSAEYGNVAGGVVSLQLKSGASHWHGSVFEFLRNDRLDANAFFSNASGQSKNPLRYNQFGGSLGGPLRRGKTFLFADYQGTLTRRAGPLMVTLPTAGQRRGDFSDLRDPAGNPLPVYDPFSPTIARLQFPGNVIPASRIDPAAARIVERLPSPNRFDAAGRPLPFNNYAVTRSAASDGHAFDVRLDHQFSPAYSVFARHSFQDSASLSPSLFGPPLGGPPTLAGTTDARFQNTGLGHNWQITPRLIHELRAGVNRQASSLLQEDYGQNLSDLFGIPGVNRSPETSGLSNLNIAGLFSMGGSILTPLRTAATNWNLSQKLLWVKARHTLRFGTDFQYEAGSTGYLVFGRGSYTFLNLSTSSAVGPPGGHAFASFLTGAPFTILRDTFPPGMAGLLSPRYGFFVQDDIKVSPQLTVNLGVRYDIMPYARERYNRLSNFDPSTRTMLLAGQDAPERLRQTDYRNLAPRIGIARAWGATVIRAGYGIGFVDPIGGASILNSNEFNIPFYLRDNITQFPFLAPAYALSSPLPELVMPSPARPVGDQRHLTPGDRNQYAQLWSLNVQRALSASTMVEIAYAGASGSRLLMSSNINAAPPGATDPVARRPFGSALGEIRALSNSAHSTYHGLQTKFEQRAVSGLFLLASYTWSKSLDNQSNGTDDSAASGQFPQDPANHALDRGLSSFDRTHRFVSSAVWELPFRPSRQLGLPGLHHLLANWQISGIFVAQSGSPFTILMPCAVINAEGNNCRPDRLSGGALPSDRQSIDRWFDIAAFAIPAAKVYGNAGRNILRGPGSLNVDLGLSRSIAWGESSVRRLQFRAESFNLLNRANFGLPVHDMNSPAFGAISTSAPARVIQLGLRLEF